LRAVEVKPRPAPVEPTPSLAYAAPVTSLRTLSTPALALAGFLITLGAGAWTSQVRFSTRVHDHSFHETAAKSSDCVLRYRLYFTAPPGGYSSRSEGLNYYRFRAHLKFASGKVFTTPVFGNRAPGERVYARDHDTRDDACWASTEQKVVGLDVEACRGQRCTPRPLP